MFQHTTLLVVGRSDATQDRDALSIPHLRTSLAFPLQRVAQWVNLRSLLAFDRRCGYSIKSHAGVRSVGTSFVISTLGYWCYQDLRLKVFKNRYKTRCGETTSTAVLGTSDQIITWAGWLSPAGLWNTMDLVITTTITLETHY